MTPARPGNAALLALYGLMIAAPTFAAAAPTPTAPTFAAAAPTPTATPDASPDASPTATPDAAPDATPPAARGYTAATLYNQGNAYARAGQTALAVLAYQRARLLTPRDPDLEVNLAHARAAAQLPAEPRSRLRSLLVGDPAPMAWLGVAGVLLLGAGLLAPRLDDRYRWPARLIAVAGVGLIGWTAGAAAIVWHDLHEAVVVTAAVPARASPVPLGDPLFVLSAGDTVEVRAAHDEYSLIETRAGRTGWVASAHLAPVVARASSAGADRR